MDKDDRKICFGFPVLVWINIHLKEKYTILVVVTSICILLDKNKSIICYHLKDDNIIKHSFMLIILTLLTMIFILILSIWMRDTQKRHI